MSFAFRLTIPPMAKTRKRRRKIKPAIAVASNKDDYVMPSPWRQRVFIFEISALALAGGCLIYDVFQMSKSGEFFDRISPALFRWYFAALAILTLIRVYLSIKLRESWIRVS